MNSFTTAMFQMCGEGMRNLSHGNMNNNGIGRPQFPLNPSKHIKTPLPPPQTNGSNGIKLPDHVPQALHYDMVTACEKTQKMNATQCSKQNENESKPNE